jgi:methylphosphotriester-DNA--protein-cysteine methyltransferase
VLPRRLGTFFAPCFKNEFGLTAREYIQQERLKTVRQLLIDPPCTLFEGVSHFIWVVKKLLLATCRASGGGW